jgi:branched-chain amino acid transport system substrate-binding protein
MSTRPAAGQGPHLRRGARLTVEAGDRVVTGDPAFFADNPALVEHARRAMAEGLAVVRYYWRSADQATLRVTIETSATERGPVATVDAAHGPRPWELTTREHEVLTCVVAGMTNPEIAGYLDCARRTVATHVERVLAKLGVGSRTAAAAIGMAEDVLLAPLPPASALDVTAVGRVTGRGAPVRPLARQHSTTHAGAKRPIRLGAIYPFDGPRRLDALAMYRGATLAMAELNARGGIGGRQLEHVVSEVSGDTHTDLIKAVEHLQAHDVDAITLGNVSPLHDLSAITLAAQCRAPLMHSMVSPTITEHVHDNPGTLGQTFQVCATESAYTAGFVRTLDLLVRSGQWQPHNRRLVFMLRRATRDAADLAAFAEVAASRGWQVDAFLPIDDIGVPWQQVVADIERSDPAAVFVCTYIEAELSRFLQQMKRSASSPLLYTVWTPSIPQFADRMGALADGLLWSTVIGTYDDPVSAPFADRYRRAYGAEPGSGSAAIHYDMVHMLAGAWSSSDRPWDFDGVVRSLRRTVHRGVAGPYYFGGRGQRALAYPDDTGDASLAHAHLVHQIQDGRSRVIAPMEIGGAAFRPPTP